MTGFEERNRRFIIGNPSAGRWALRESIGNQMDLLLISMVVGVIRMA